MSDEQTRKKPDVRSMIKRSAASTRDALKGAILAPVIPQVLVRVKVDGIVCELKVDNEDGFLGWALLEVTEPGRARIVEAAAPAQVKAYLNLLPRVQLVLLNEKRGMWWAVPAQASDQRFKVSGPVPVQLCTRAGSFDTVNARFDGAAFWYDDVVRNRNPVVARRLRDALSEDVFPEDLHCKEMTSQEALAYCLVFFDKHRDLLEPVSRDGDGNLEEPGSEPQPVTPTFDYWEWFHTLKHVRLTKALAHAGARLDSYWGDGGSDVLSVRFIIDGDTHVASLNMKDFTVLSAGVCLSGMDSDFDLTSLVGVLRERKRTPPEWE